MADEKKKTASEGMATDGTETINGHVVVVREPILDKNGKQMQTKEGRDYFAYCVRGIVRGRAVKADFTPKDFGGYEPLDIVFDVSPKAELFMEERESESDKTGRITKYMAYWVRSVDDDGRIYECNVKPQRDSDKALLGMLLNYIGG